MTCPNDKPRAIGGGGGNGVDALVFSGPSPVSGAPTGWQVSVKGGTATAYAICVAAS